MLKLVTSILGAVLSLIVLLAAAVSGVVSVLLGTNGAAASQPSDTALSDIPADYLDLYRLAAPACPGLDWAVLAAIGKAETNHGRLDAAGVHNGENYAGAAGPMQFLQPTFQSVIAEHPIPPGGSTPPSRYHPHDAIHAAASYLCDNGARDNRDLNGAIFTYNRADWYVQQVLNQAHTYRAAQPTPTHQHAWAVPTEGRCTSGFGPRAGDVHRGQDIAAPVGTPIVAASAGTVLDSGPATGYGLWVRIQHPDGMVSTYGHNHRNHVRGGDEVQAGQPIAEVGNRGESTGAHLHFQVETAGHAVDPIRFYGQHSDRSLCG